MSTAVAPAGIPGTQEIRFRRPLTEPAPIIQRKNRHAGILQDQLRRCVRPAGNATSSGFSVLNPCDMFTGHSVGRGAQVSRWHSASSFSCV